MSSTPSAVVVDLELVEHAVAEAVEVRAALRILERDPGGDQRHRVGCVRTDERVYIGGVGLGIAADERRLAMARRPARHQQVPDTQHYEHQEIETSSHRCTSLEGGASVAMLYRASLEDRLSPLRRPRENLRCVQEALDGADQERVTRRRWHAAAGSTVTAMTAGAWMPTGT